MVLPKRACCDGGVPMQPNLKYNLAGVVPSKTMLRIFDFAALGLLCTIYTVLTCIQWCMNHLTDRSIM